MSLNPVNKRFIAILTALIITGCGGGGSSSSTGGTVVPTNVTGKFVDATVVGISYKCGTSTTVSGTTTANGEFTCPSGQTVAFYVGDILLGSATASALVTPLDLVGTGATPAHPTVANIVRFLMSISSTDPATGTLTITPAVIAAGAGKTVDFTATTAAAINSLIPTLKPGATIYTSAQASTHVTASVNGLFAGNYAGTYSGAMSGTWSFTIATDGTVTGMANGAAITGAMATSLSTGSTYAFTGTAGGTPWAGTLNVSTKVLSGTWDAGTGSSGTWSGAAISTSPTVSGYAPKTGAVGATVSITGTNLGKFIPAPLVKFGTTNAGGPYTNVSNSNVTFTVPAGLAAGTHTITISNLDGSAAITVGTFTVSAAPVGAAGLTFAPAFNGTSTFANAVPLVAGSSFVYSQNSYQQQFNISYFPLSGSTPESLTITASAIANLTPQAALVNQLTTANNMSPTCALTTHALLPPCSNAGITFNKAAGNITFTNTPMAINTGATAPQATAFTVNGTLTFTPF